jgi:hypothetical protein
MGLTMQSAVRNRSGSRLRRYLTVLCALVLVGSLSALAGAAGSEPDKAAPPAPEQPDNPEIFRREGPDPAPPLNADDLAKVTDGRPLPELTSKFDRHGKVAPGTAKEVREEDEAAVFVEALIKANQYPARSFAVSARRDLGYSNLFHDTRMYRGEVVHVEGRMRRLTRRDTAMPNLVAEGIHAYFEGWIFNPDLYGPRATVCVLFTELPEGLAPAEKMDRRVAFDGYLFKRYRYESADAKAGHAREAPLLIGHAPVVGKVEAGVESSPTAMLSPLMYGLLIFFGAAILLVILLAWWLQRGDQRVHRQLADASAQRFVDQIADEVGPASLRVEPGGSQPEEGPPGPNGTSPRTITATASNSRESAKSAFPAPDP